MHEKLQEICRKVQAGDLDWFRAQKIAVRRKWDFWLLNYGPAAVTEYNRLARGLLIRRHTGEPMLFPFTRFFDVNDPNADELGSGGYAIEKMDGTMVSVRRQPGGLIWATRRLLGCDPDDVFCSVTPLAGGEPVLLGRIVGARLRRLNLRELDPEITYIFELVHPRVPVLSEYPKERHGLYLIGARNMQKVQDGCNLPETELDELELDEQAERLAAKRPRKQARDSGDPEQFRMQLQEERPDSEGIILRDGASARVKVKNEQYLLAHRFLGVRGLRYAVSAVMRDEFSDVVEVFPHLRRRFHDVQRAITDVIDTIVVTVAYIRHLHLEPAEAWDYVNKQFPAQAFHRYAVMRALRKEPQDIYGFVKDLFMGRFVRGDCAAPAVLHALGLKNAYQGEAAE